MKKVLVAVVVLAGIAAAFWWSRKDAPRPDSRGDASASAATTPPSSAGAPLSGASDAQSRTGTNAAPKAAPAAGAAPEVAPVAPRTARELPQEFLDFAPNLSRPDLLGYRDKIRANVSERAEALRAERGGAPSRSIFAETRGSDPWAVALQHVPPGYIGFAVPRGYEKENGGERFDLYLYPEDDDAEWATALLELRWIEERLVALPE